MKTNNLKVYCILIPTLIGDKFVKTRHHKCWDSYVRKITGGLTIFAPGKGQWVSPENGLIEERIIPVNIACKEEDFEKIIKFTIGHYRQEAVMAYKVSDDVYVLTKDDFV